MKLPILIDADGVLYDFVTPALAALRACGGPELHHDQLDRYEIESHLAPEHRPAFWQTVTREGFCAGLSTYDGSGEALEQLRQLGDVVCVTSPMSSPHWAHERAQRLIKDFGFTRKTIVSTSGKQWVAGSFLADDSPEHLDAWYERNGSADGPARAFLIRRPWNGSLEGDDWPGGSLADFVNHVRRWS